MGRIRRFDDAYSDPDMIAAKYRTGQNAFFEVELALAELSDFARSSSSGGTQGSPDFVALEETHGDGGEIILEQS